MMLVFQTMKHGQAILLKGEIGRRYGPNGVELSYGNLLSGNFQTQQNLVMKRGNLKPNTCFEKKG